MFTLSLDRFQFLAPAAADIGPAAAHLALRRRELLVLPRPPLGQRVSCRSGSLWLTVDDCPDDIVLAPGEAFVCDSRRRVIVQALHDAQLSVSR